jgi:hypothetical protein
VICTAYIGVNASLVSLPTFVQWYQPEVNKHLHLTAGQNLSSAESEPGCRWGPP